MHGWYYRLLNVSTCVNLVKFSTPLTRKYSVKMSKRHHKDEYKRQKKWRSQPAVRNQKLPYLTPNDEGFQKLMKEKYGDFAHAPCSSFPEDLKEDLAWAFNMLESKGYFYRDWVRVRGKLVLTPISRTLVGAPGKTYKYLGLRLFTLPWEFESGHDLNDIEQACSIIGKLNDHFRVTSRQLLHDRQKMNPAGDCSAETIESKISSDADQLQSCVEKSETTQETDILNNKEKSNGLENTSVKCNDGECDVTQCPELRNEPLQSDKGVQEVTTNLQSVDEEKDLSSSHVVRISTLEGSVDTGQCRKESQGDGDLSASECLQSSNKDPECERKDEITVTDADHHNQPSHHHRRPEVRAKTIEEGTDYSVALINYMDPQDPDLNLKPEPYYGMGPLAVSWHMDGNLVRGSTVAVYSYTCETTSGSSLRDWTIGVKVSWDSDTPGLAVPLASGDSYFMLADLNDTHQHCVMAGDQPRFSSTHRVVECSRGTLNYIQDRCRTAVENLMKVKDTSGEHAHEKPVLKSLESETIKFTEEVHNEVEFEWLRQFWMQGSRHAAERTYWIQPMEELEHMWESMELVTKLAIDAALSDDTSSQQAKATITVLLPFLEMRDKLRYEWTNRFGSDIILSMEPDMVPLYRPSWDDGDPTRPLPFTLTKVIEQLKSRLQEIRESS